MTNSNSNVRRSIGPRKAGEGDPAGETDPLAELTRFMGGPEEAAPRPARRAEADRGDESSEPEAHPRRIPRRPFLAGPETDAPDPAVPADDTSVEARQVDEPMDDSGAEGATVPADRFSEATDFADDDSVAAEPDPLADQPEDGAVDDDPFMQALLEELESDGSSASSDAPASDSAPRVRPSFSFPSAKPAEAPRPTFSRATPTAPVAPSAPERPRPVFGNAAPRPAEPAGREADERVEHARDHDAISSEAAGALEQLRSRLARHGPAEPAAGEASPAQPAPAKAATSWTSPVSPPAPGERPRPFLSRANPVASETPERPGFGRASTAPVPEDVREPVVESIPETPEPVGWERETEPSAVEDEVPVTEAPDDGGSSQEIEHFADSLADAGTDEADDDAGWTLDEEALANAIAQSVGGHVATDEDDDPLETVYGDDEFSLDEVSAEEAETAVADDLDDIDFEFDLGAGEPDATAEDFRRPAERGDTLEDPDAGQGDPLDPAREDAPLPPPPSFVRAMPAGPADADDPGGDEATLDSPADADDADPDSEPDDDAGPPSVFPALPPKVRRAVPAFRFDLDEPDRSREPEPEPAAKAPGSDLDFDLPGLGGNDPWSRWPAASSQAAKTGPSGTAVSGGAMADRLSSVLFDEDPRQPAAPPRSLRPGAPLTDDDWPSKPGGATALPAADDASDGYEEDYEDDAYDDDYYDESEPEWDDEHALPPHSLEEMDSALGLSERPRRRLGRPVAAVVLLLVLGGGGYAAYSMLSGGEQVADGPPPVIKADTDGVKVMAENETDAPSDGSKAIYDRVGESGAESGRLVRSREEPIDPSQASAAGNGLSSPLLPKRVRTVVVRPDGTIIPAEELNAGSGNTAGLVAPVETSSDPTSDPLTTSPTPVADTAPETGPSAPGTDTAESAAALPGTTETAGAETVPAESAPGSDAQEEDTAEAPAAEVLSPIRTSERIVPEPDATPAPRPAPSEDTRTVSTTRVTAAPDTAAQQRGPLSLVPDAGTAGTVQSPTLPAPSRSATPETSVGERVSPAVLAAQTRRANQQAAQPQSQTQTAATQPAATSAPATVASGPWAVQVSSQRSADQARAAYRQLQQRFPAVLGGREPAIQVADLGDRGTFYRVRLPTQTREAANQLCADLKAAGGDCFVGRN